MARIIEYRRMPKLHNPEHEVWRAPVHTRWVVTGVLLAAVLGVALIKFALHWLG